VRNIQKTGRIVPFWVWDVKGCVGLRISRFENAATS